MRRSDRSRVAVLVAAVMLIGFSFPASVLAQQTERSMTGQITVTSGTNCFNISLTGGQTIDVVNQWIVRFSVYHSNWTMMNSSAGTGSSIPNVTVMIWMNWSAGTKDSPDSNQTHYTFAVYPNASSTWFEVGPDAATDSHLISCTNTSNQSLTVVGNDPVMVHYRLTFQTNADARFANSTGSVTGAWFLSVMAEDNESNVGFYDNATAHYMSYYGHITVDDSTWAVTMVRGSGIKNESEVHNVVYTVNFYSDLQASGDIFNHSGGYGANQFIMPDNVSIAWAAGGSTVLSATPRWAGGWVNLTWFWTDAAWNSTVAVRHRVDLSGVPGTLTLGTYSGSTYLLLRQH